MPEEEKLFTPEEVEALVAEKLAAAKADGDKAFENLWGEAKAAKERAKAFDGLDPNEVRDKLARLTELEQLKKANKAGITSEELEKLRADVRKDLEGEFSPYKTKAETLAQQIRELRLDNVVKSAMGKNGVRGERVDALFRLAADRFDLTEDGKPMLKEHPGREIDKYIAEQLSEEYPEFFNGSGSSGGGALKPSAGGGGVRKTIAVGDESAFLAELENIAKGATEVR